MRRFHLRLLAALLAVLATTAAVMAVFTRVLVGYHTSTQTQTDPAESAMVGHFLDLLTTSLAVATLVGAALAVAASVALARRLTRPLERLAASARALGRGDYTQRIAPSDVVELADIAHAFNDMAAGLAEVETRRKQLVANVSHELRSPLSSIRGYLQGLNDGVFEPGEPTYTALLAETDRMVRMVDDLQTLARAETADLPLHPAPTPVHELVSPLVHTLQPRLDDQQLHLHLDLPDDLPPLYVDPHWTRTLLAALLDNALRYTPAGGAITLTARPHAGPYVKITVTDTGPGIGPEHLPHIFERFYRADRARTPTAGGAGIGLAIAKHVAARHGGTITATSQTGTGTTITVILPTSEQGRVVEDDADASATGFDGPHLRNQVQQG